MRKTFLIIVAFMFTATINAQSDKYIKAMEKNVAAIDTTWNTDGLIKLANAFQLIADAEKNQWLPYYYASLCNVLSAYTLNDGNITGMAATTDPIANKAEELLNKAEMLKKDNSEIFCVKKMIASLRLMGDPQSRAMTYGTASAMALTKAKQLDPGNPRVYLLEGQDKLYTPKEWGGSKEEAMKIFDEAKKKYESFKPESSIHPAWGKTQLNYFLTQG